MATQFKKENYGKSARRNPRGPYRIRRFLSLIDNSCAIPHRNSYNNTINSLMPGPTYKFLTHNPYKGACTLYDNPSLSIVLILNLIKFEIDI